jgi:galactonate dehydratase
VPTYALLGGKVRDTLPVYANINRATDPRTPAGFAAAARRAVADGFKAIKAAPWDGFPPPGSLENEIARAVDTGIASVAAMREAVGSQIAIMVDCHSFFDIERAVRVAERLEPYSLTWYEEPVPPERVEDTLAIKTPDSSAYGGR